MVSHHQHMNSYHNNGYQQHHQIQMHGQLAGLGDDHLLQSHQFSDLMDSMNNSHQHQDTIGNNHHHNHLQAGTTDLSEAIHNSNSTTTTTTTTTATANHLSQNTTTNATPATTTNVHDNDEHMMETDDELQFINQIHDDHRSRFGLNRGDACEILALTLAEAHVGTCLVSTERISELISAKKRENLQSNNGQSGQTQLSSANKRYEYLRSMSYEELWLECANRLTNIIQQIIEFAKMVPSFMLMEQDDQIVLLKAGSFELCCLRISRYYDLETNQLLFGNGLIPMELFTKAAGK